MQQTQIDTRINPMKRTYFLIAMLLLIPSLFPSNGFAQDHTRYVTFIGHASSVSSVVFSPDGQTLASGSYDNTIRLWNVQTGTHLRTLMGHTDRIYSVVFSPDGRTLASSSYDNTIRLWNVQTGIHLRALTGHRGSVYSVVFSPDGAMMASGSGDGTIRLWSAQTGIHLRTLTGHTAAVNSISFRPDGQMLASGSYDGVLRLWEVHTGRHIHKLSGHISSVVFSPDGQTLASGSLDKTIRLWDVDVGRHIRTLIGHTRSVNSISFSSDGQTLASGSADHTIRLWDVGTGKHHQTLTGYTGEVSSVVFSPDGRTIASGSSDGTIRLWKLSTPRPVEHYSPTLPKTAANRIYDNAIRSVMWIVNPGVSEGSSVLFDKQYKLAATNAHVLGEQNTIDVYFPAPDEKGELIKDRNFYLTSSGVLKRLGYYTKGHVVARDEETDLAIIKLDGIPETAREIDWNLTMPATNTGDLVYILGNPGGQDLWRWTLGEYLKDHGDFLHIQSDVFRGNSGGPVLNKQGTLIGIVARSDRHMNALAIPVRDISKLLSKSQLKHSRSRR